ncbi:MAG: hypothetical protein ACREHD_26625 [Pirellulales bacterium]
MAKRRRVLDLAILDSIPPESLRLPSLEEGMLHGPAYRYTVTLPLFSKDGEEIFSQRQHIGPLVALLARRFGGYTRTSITPHAPLEGGWLPEPHGYPVVDRNIWIQVYARIEAEGSMNPADLFFGYLKSLLKKAAYVKQDEILVERAHVELLPAIRLPKGSPA